MPHYMIDIETTGTRPDRAAILQIAAVRFDPVARSIDHDGLFNMCLRMPGWRFWDDDTRRWWQAQNQDVFQRILFNAQDPRAVTHAFLHWVNADHAKIDDRYFWAKNAAFDFMFLASYGTDYDTGMPFSYRNVNDMKAFIRGRCFPDDIPVIDQAPTDQAHDAIVDCIMQIDWLFKALDATP